MSEEATDSSSEDSPPADSELDSLLAEMARAPERLSPQILRLEPGERVGHYEIRELLGKGGMGFVYKAWDQCLQRTVALKLLLLRNSASFALLLNEARAGAALRHPNIATIYSVEEWEGLAFLTMELVDGEPLSQVLRKRRLPAAEALLLARQVASALAAAHAVGLVHRDLKPGNILVQLDGQVKLLDFGLARFIHGSGETASPPGGVMPPEGVAGTRAYMSPEQEAGLAVGQTSDVFSYGLLLYEMLTGQLPEYWRQRRVGANALGEGDKARLAAAGVPAALTQVLVRCLWREPGARFQNGGEVEQALQALSEARGGRLEGLGRTGAWLAAVGVAGLVGWTAWSLSSRSAVTQTAQPQVQLRRLTALAPERWLRDAALNPDGDSFAYVERDGSVSLQRAGEEEPHTRLQPPAGQRAYRVSWQDERTLLLVLLDSEDEHASIWRLTGPSFTWERFLPEGQSITASPVTKEVAWLKQGEIWGMEHDGSGARRLVGAEAQTELIAPLRFSPDGSHLAFIRRDIEGNQHALVIMPVAGGQEHVVLRDSRLMMPGQNGSFTWLPDRFVISLADEAPDEEGANLWELPVSTTGQPRGPLRRLTSWSGSWGLVSSGYKVDATGAQQLLITQSTLRYSTSVAPLKQGPALGAARQLTQLQRNERLSRWSFDSQRLWVTAGYQGRFALIGYGLAEEHPLKLIHPTDWLTHAQPSPDGGLLFWQVSSASGPPTLELKHQDAGREESRSLLRLMTSPTLSLRAPLPLFDAVRCVAPSQARSAPSPCVLARSDAAGTSFTAIDPRQGEGRGLFRLDKPMWVMLNQWDLSADGLRIASTGSSPKAALEVYGLNGRLLRSYPAAEGCSQPTALAWAADGRGLFYSCVGDGESRFALYHVDEQGHQTELLASTYTYFRYLAASADGRYLAWSGMELDNDVWQVLLR